MTDVKLTPAQRRALNEMLEVKVWTPSGEAAWRMARTLMALGLLERHRKFYSSVILTDRGREVIANA